MFGDGSLMRTLISLVNGLDMVFLATCRLQISEVDWASINNGIATNMRHPLGTVRNLVGERGHQLSHVECRVETRSRSRSRREKMSTALASDSMYDL